MKLAGIKWYVIWITWLLRSLMVYVVLSLVLSAVTKITLNPRQSGSLYGTKAVFKNTDWILVFSIFIVYSIQTAMFTLLAGQIFRKSSVKQHALI